MIWKLVIELHVFETETELNVFLMFSYFPPAHIMSYSPYYNSIHRANSFTIIKDLLFLSAIFSHQRSTVVRCDQGSTGKEPSCRHGSHEVVPGIIGEATGCWTLHASWNTGQSIRKVVQNYQNTCINPNICKTTHIMYTITDCHCNLVGHYYKVHHKKI